MGDERETKPTIKVLSFGKKGLTESNALPSLEKNAICWIDIESPTSAIMKDLVNKFKLHPFTVDETLDDIIQVPALTPYEDFEFITLTRIHYKKETKGVEPAETDVYLFKNLMITIHKSTSKTSEYIRQKIKNNPQLLNRGIDYILYMHIDAITNGLLLNIEAWDDQILALEERILKEQTKNMLREITVLRRNLTIFRRGVSQQRELFSKLARGESSYIQQKNLVYFRDVYDHATRATFMLENAREILASTFEAYLSITSNRMNQVMKQLTIISTIFLPLTFIVGLYGMNFDFMPELHSQYGYPAVLIGMTILTLGMIYYFKKKEWF